MQLDRVHLGQMHLEAARLDEKSLKTQNATEFAQLDKKLLLSRWRECLTEKHSRVTTRVHPLVAESITVSDVGVGAASSLSIVRER